MGEFKLSTSALPHVTPRRKPPLQPPATTARALLLRLSQSGGDGGRDRLFEAWLPENRSDWVGVRPALAITHAALARRVGEHIAQARARRPPRLLAQEMFSLACVGLVAKRGGRGWGGRCGRGDGRGRLRGCGGGCGKSF